MMRLMKGTRAWVVATGTAALVVVASLAYARASDTDVASPSTSNPPGPPATVHPALNCGPTSTSIACENARPGDPSSQWDVPTHDSGDVDLQGFATKMSVNVGETVSFKIRSAAPSYRLDIYRMGFYGGAGARKVATIEPTVPLPQAQPACLSDPTTGLVDCGNWAVSSSWTVPADATSGIYFAHLVRGDTGGNSHITFIVRDDAKRSDLLVQVPDEMWTAYNSYGGSSLYEGGQLLGRAFKVSYNRPNNVRGGPYSRTSMFDDVYPMVRFLEANGYDLTYATGGDVDANGAALLQHRAFVSVGHDEYWSAQQRTNVEAARDAGINLAFFSGNEMFWKTRWEPSVDGSRDPYRTLVSYKESMSDQAIDPADPPTWTGTWRDPRFSPPGDGGRPENAVTGTLFKVGCCAFEPITVSTEQGKQRFWRNTNLQAMDRPFVDLSHGVVGYEFDVDPDNGYRPAGQIDLSATTVTGSNVLSGYGDTYVRGTATHSLTMHRAPSGALVFGAGTVHWVWALDDHHDADDIAPPPVEPRIQQATVNLLADMGAQPVTLLAGLVRAAASTDQATPTSSVTPPADAVFATEPLTITGTATDAGGGVVGGVEVTTDGGQHWHPATGTAQWTYRFTPDAPGPVTIQSRATDDSLNTEPVSPGITVVVGPARCPCTIFRPSAAPLFAASASDPTGVELGLKFRADVPGLVTGVRFYKSDRDNGTHVGHLWTSTGQLLASVEFSDETADGWQTATFDSVPIAAGTTYIVSYFSTSGVYAAENDAFAGRGIDNGHLHALASGVDGPNGVYHYGGQLFPDTSFRSSNYFADVLFKPSA